MRAVVQRVRSARVFVNTNLVGSIEKGLVVFVGIKNTDNDAALHFMQKKILGLRIFSDEQDRMTYSVRDVQGSILIVSQFTVYGDVRRGNRPSFSEAMEPVEAEKKYNQFVEQMRSQDVPVATGQFRANMQVEVENDGPVTLIVDSQTDKNDCSPADGC